MASAQWRHDPDLIRRLRSAPHRFHLVQAIRLLAIAEPGAGLPPARLRFRSPASLGFPPSEVLGLAAAGTAEELTVGVPGLTGPAGALPDPYTELLIAGRDPHADSALHAFLDLFGHRALVLSHAAWRKHRLAPALERGADAGAAAPLLALAGLGPDPKLPPTPPTAGLGCPGALARRPLPGHALAAMLSAHFGAPARLQPWAGRWLCPGEPPPLGSRSCVLGAGTRTGVRVWDRQTRLGLRLGPLEPDAFRRLLPGGPDHPALARLTQAGLGHAFGCDLTLELAAGGAPAPALDTRRGQPPRLGCDLWLASRPSERTLDDARFRLLP
jgi:type VI secretion system protein ImpH